MAKRSQESGGGGGGGGVLANFLKQSKFSLERSAIEKKAVTSQAIDPLPL